MDSQPSVEGMTAPIEPKNDNRRELTNLLLVVAVVVIGSRLLKINLFDTALVAFGGGLIIFLHELGHFVAAKLCDVHVKTFSIGFGPALPFCRFRYGETTYKMAMIPLGGFVAMVGEEEGEEGDEATSSPDYPRSFKNKSVLRRMIIISAGVIMNLILAAALFVVAYMHGVHEAPAVIARVEAGSTAWQNGIHTGTELKSLNGDRDPWFDDVRVEVMSTQKDEKLSIDGLYRGAPIHLEAEPIRMEKALYPQMGFAPADKPELYFDREGNLPYFAQSAAQKAEGPNGAKFLPGDRIVGMTDPDDLQKVTPLRENFDDFPMPIFDYDRRMRRLIGKPVTLEVVRRGDESNTKIPITIPPAYRNEVGLRMRMGQIKALRRGGPAEKAGILVGDRIVAVETTSATGVVRRTADKSEPAPHSARIEPLDPVLLARDLEIWADSQPSDLQVRVTVLRSADHTEKRLPFSIPWDAAYRYERSSISGEHVPMALDALGLAYEIKSIVDAVEPGSSAANAGLQPDDRITELRFQTIDLEGKETFTKWSEVQETQWAYVETILQSPNLTNFEVKIERTGVAVTLPVKPNLAHPVADRGFQGFQLETRIQLATSVDEALKMGIHRTRRAVRMTYLGLYSLVFGRMSAKLISGPLTLGNLAYRIAQDDPWKLIIFLAMISVNLAVVNFLPIPVLDGGHMVFLIYEAIRGKPAPVSVQIILTYAGLAIVGSLMLFAIGLDVWRFLK